MDECRELLEAHRARHVPVRVHRVDDHERLLETPPRGTVELDDESSAPSEARLQDPAERPVFQDQELAEVSAEAEDFRLRTVDPDPLRPRFQESNLVRLAILDPAEDIVDVERRAVHGAHPLRGVRNPVARDDFDLEPAIPSAGVGMLGVQMRPAFEDFPESETPCLEVLPRNVTREGDEDIDLRARQVGSFREGAGEERLRVPPALLERRSVAFDDLADHGFDYRFLLAGRPYL